MSVRNLKSIIKRAEKGTLALALKKYDCCGVFSFGAVDISPKHLAIWITTETDEQRDFLNHDSKFQRDFRETLRSVGYPESAISDVGLAIESQETVDRDFQGNWWYAVK